MADQYFATLPTTEAGQEVWDRIERYYGDMESSGIYSLLKAMYANYFGSSDSSAYGRKFRSHEMTRGGKDGETFDLKVNELRNLVQHLIVMTTSERPQLDAIAANTDSKSQAQSELASGLLEYFMTEQRIERDLVQAVEYACVLGGGYIHVPWVASAGKQYGVDPESGRVIYEGDIDCMAKTPLDVPLDPNCERGDESWMAVRDYENRWDLIAEYPEKESEILAVETKAYERTSYALGRTLTLAETDEIPVFTFYHRRSPAVPDGRMLVLLSGGEVLFDGPLPYKKIPIYGIQPGRLFGTPYGYSPAFDLLALQSGVDALTSAFVTNQSTFGIQSLQITRGHNISLVDLDTPLNIYEMENDHRLEPVQLTQTSPEIFRGIEILQAAMERLIGLNSIVRGNPQGQLSGASGSAMALLASQAIQFSYGLQREYEALCEDVGTDIVHKLQTFASTPRMALIAGVSKRGYLKQFTGDDIGRVDRVTVRRSSALSKVTSGKLEIAKDLMNAGMIESPEQYLSVVKTGNLEPLVEHQRRELILIKAENEKLREGGQVQAVILDNHALHIKEHKAVLSDPEAREDPTIVESVLAHIAHHIEILRTGDPDVLALSGNQSLAPQMMPPAGAAGEVGMTQEEAIGAEGPSQPRMPSLPQGAPEEAAAAYEQIQG